jgi:hypothetical protein
MPEGLNLCQHPDGGQQILTIPAEHAAPSQHALPAAHVVPVGQTPASSRQLWKQASPFEVRLHTSVVEHEGVALEEFEVQPISIDAIIAIRQVKLPIRPPTARRLPRRPPSVAAAASATA